LGEVGVVAFGATGVVVGAERQVAGGVFQMARAAIERLVGLREVSPAVRRVVEEEAGPPRDGPRAEIGVVVGEALELLRVTSLATGVGDRREVVLRAVVFLM